MPAPKKHFIWGIVLLGGTYLIFLPIASILQRYLMSDRPTPLFYFLTMLPMFSFICASVWLMTDFLRIRHPGWAKVLRIFFTYQWICAVILLTVNLFFNFLTPNP